MEKLLIVEGEEDQKFFAAASKSLALDGVKIHFHPGGKDNALAAFIGRLTLATRASNLKLGLVVDADFDGVSPSGGFSATRAQINRRLAQVGFSPLTSMPATSGMVSRKAALGGVVAGVWVMPNNCDDGQIEGFLISAISPSESPRFAYASQIARAVVAGSHGGPTYDVKKHHSKKAELGTWLAWSDPPRISLGGAVSRGLVDTSGAAFSPLAIWLRALFG